MTKTRCYSELYHISTFVGRYDYLVLKDVVGVPTFGFDRWMNQQFYRSRSWQLVRSQVIYRDRGCDLGIVGYDIYEGLLVHHMNPITPEDIEKGADWIIDPEFLITTTQRTHNAIHYGDRSLLATPFVERQYGDTTLW